MTVEKNKHLHACDRRKIAKVLFLFLFGDTEESDVKIVFREFNYDVNIEIVMSVSCIELITYWNHNGFYLNLNKLV